MKEQEAVESFVSRLEAPSDLMALAHACSVMTRLALDEQLRREGKDNHAANVPRGCPIPGGADRTA
jgi:hypothetical protein